jgi:hypothetical protein
MAFRKEVQFCMLAKDLDDASYNSLVRSLCRKHSVPIVEVESRQQLGLIAGQYRMRVVDETYFEYPRVRDFKTGKEVTKKVAKVRKNLIPTKVIPCSCAAVYNHGRDGESAAELEDRFVKALRGIVESAAAAATGPKKEGVKRKR